MTETVNTRELALDIVTEVLERGGYSHRVIGAVLDKYQYLGKKERAFVTQVSKGTIQRAIEMDAVIDRFSRVRAEKMKPLIRSLLRMSVYQLRYLDFVPDAAVCNEAVKLARKRGFASLGGFVNGVLRNIARHPGEFTYPDEKEDVVRAFSVRYSMPEWITRQWIADYGRERTREMLEALLLDVPLTIRPNLARITPEALAERLESEGACARPLEAKTGAAVPYALTLSGFDSLGKLPSFAEGLFYVQDINSMAVAEWAAPGEGDYCIDVCAAPGGKSLHLAEKLAGTGHVEARDLTEAKAGLIRENRKRHGLSNLSVKCRDAAVFDADAAGTADLVLADLPCSGLGVLRRKADIKYRMTPALVGELAALQRQILDVVCAYVKPGGRLIYSTCTVSRAENEDNVRWFAGAHPEFTVEKMEQMFPGRGPGDGFFIAKCVRTGDGL